VSGSQRFSIKRSGKFESSYKKIKSSYKSDHQREKFNTAFIKLITGLVADPRHPRSRFEPLPSNFQLPTVWEFRKLEFKVVGFRGAAAQGRLMYLVNFEQEFILLVWVYTHEEFRKRPPDGAIKSALKDAIAQLNGDETEDSR
jgi:hypothetical protein